MTISTKNLTCSFLICPFTPKEWFDQLYELLNEACVYVGKQLACRVECLRADKISGTGVIHSEIWHEIQTADVVIADVSGFNGNVMMELGVASAFRKKQHVIILKEENPNEHFLFDIAPVRHIIYTKTNLPDIFQKVSNALIMALTSAPFELPPYILNVLPLQADFTKGHDVVWLVGPSMTHRRLTSAFLEFGSLFVFRNSWLSVNTREISKFEIYAEIKFSQLRNIPGWIGISVRNQNFFANYGHLLYLHSKGEVRRTIPENDLGQYRDEAIGSFSNFDPMAPKFHKFRIKIDDNVFSMFVDDIGEDYKITEMPYVYQSGKILFQTYNARMSIRNIGIKQ